MASVKKIENKNGVSYKITVCCGYDSENKKIVKNTTYKPDPTLTANQQKKSLERFTYEFEDKIKNGCFVDGDKLPFEEFALMWLADIEKNNAYSTYESYKRMLAQNIIPYFKGCKLATIKIPLVESFYDKLANHYSYASIQKCAHILSGIFKDAIRKEIISQNPCQNARIPKRAKKEVELKYFTPQESLSFLRSLNMEYEVAYKSHNRVDDTGKPYHVNEYTETIKVATQYKVFYYISLFCGLRKSETLALHWSDISFENKEISISKSVSISKDGVTFKEPKTQSSIRTVAMPDEIIPLLQQYRTEYALLKLSLGDAWKGCDNLFIQSDGKLMGRTTTYHYFVKHIKRFNQWIDLHKEEAEQHDLIKIPMIPLHGLRHSCATLHNYLGTSIIEISEILGHAQTSTTMNIYTHSFKEQRRLAVDKLDEFVRAANA